jgi:hypothetical protein
MRWIWAVTLGSALAGCTVPGTQVLQVANNTYEIRVPAPTSFSGSPDPVTAARPAKETCPKGYDELQRGVDRRGDRAEFVLTIRCL